MSVVVHRRALRCRGIIKGWRCGVNSFFKYVLAMMWGVISEVFADMLKQFVHGF